MGSGAAVVLASLLIAAVAGLVALYLVARRRPRARAEALLREHLSPADLAFLDQHGFLEVPSRIDAGRVYRVPAEGSVTVVQDGVPVLRLCIQPARPLPGREAVLAHKVLIEAAEPDYVRQANLIWRNWDLLGDTSSADRWRAVLW